LPTSAIRCTQEARTEAREVAVIVGKQAEPARRVREIVEDQVLRVAQKRIAAQAAAVARAVRARTVLSQRAGMVARH
jgi:hypothetical protein